MIDRARAIGFALALALSASSIASAQSADEMQSRALFEQARALADQGKWAEACPRFQAAHDLHATGGTALQAGNCYEKIGKSARAVELYQYILDNRNNEKNQERIQIAEERIAAIKGLPPPPPLAPSPSSTAPLASSSVVAPTSSPPPSVDTVAPPPPDAPASRAPAIAAFAAGGAGLVVGTVFGILALSKASDATSRCNAGHCPVGDGEKADQAKTLGVVSTIGFGVGVVGAGAGVLLLMMGNHGPKNVTATASGVGVRF